MIKMINQTHLESNNSQREEPPELNKVFGGSLNFQNKLGVRKW